jgi:two-component system response regulator PilR (NtrC family)
VRTPPLRERAADIPVLAEHMLKKLAATAGLPSVPKLDESAIRRLLTYDFPGNVRELENILERALTLSDGKVITGDDLQLRSAAPASEAMAMPLLQRETLTPTSAPAASSGSAGLDDRVEELERRAIRDALEKTRYNKTKAAALLGLTFRQLRYKVKKLNLE